MALLLTSLSALQIVTLAAQVYGDGNFETTPPPEGRRTQVGKSNALAATLNLLGSVLVHHRVGHSEGSCRVHCTDM